jgi:PEP-CTERM motif
MPQPCSRLRAPAALVACVAIMLAAMTAAWGAVISSTPTLPVIGSSYASSTGVGCFPAVPPAGVCIAPGTFTLTSLVSSTFDATGQDIVANVFYAGILTTLGNVPIGPISLSGTMEQEVHGRTSPTELGTWATELISLSLSGPVLGHTLTLMLDPLHSSTGVTSIVPLGDNGETLFRIDSFFDVFVELTLDTPTPLHTTRGPIRASLVPEPSTLALLAGALVAFASRRPRKAASS